MSNPYAPPDDRPRGDEPPPPRPAGPPPGSDGSDGRGGTGGNRGPGSGRGWGLPPREPVTPPDPADVAAFLASTRLTAVLALGGLVLLLLPMPWTLAALPFAVGALVQGVRAFRRAGERRIVAEARRGMTILLAVASGTVLVTAAGAALWPIQAPYERCRDAALTVQAQQACLAEQQRRTAPSPTTTPTPTPTTTPTPDPTSS